MEGDYKFPLMSDENIDERKKELIEKYKHVDGERVRFWSEYIRDENLERGNWLVWDGEEVKQVDRIDIEEYDSYYEVVGFEQIEDGWLCFADRKLTAPYNFDDL